MRLRHPGEEVANIRDCNPNLSEVLFLFMGTGVSLGGFLWLVLGSYQQLRQAVGGWIIDRGWYWLGEPGPIWLMAVYPKQREVFRWFDFFLISGYMLAWTVLTTVVLSAATAAAAALSGRLGGDADFRRRFIELGYQFLPVAMVSLLLGLGGDLFRNLQSLGLTTFGIAIVKGALFLGGIAWSIGLGDRILARQAVPLRIRGPPLSAGVLGSFAIGAAWYPAIFAGCSRLAASSLQYVPSGRGIPVNSIDGGKDVRTADTVLVRRITAALAVGAVLCSNFAWAGEQPAGEPLDKNGVRIIAVYLQPVEMEPAMPDQNPGRAISTLRPTSTPFRKIPMAFPRTLQRIPYLSITYKLNKREAPGAHPARCSRWSRTTVPTTARTSSSTDRAPMF